MQAPSKQSTNTKSGRSLTSGLVDQVLRSPSTLSLVAVNLVTIAIALTQGWKLSDLLWIYWAQSVIIGIFQFIKILSLKNFSTKNFRINERSVKPTQKTKQFTAYFFAFHYGFFHFIYLIFLFTWFEIDVTKSFLLILLFFINHLFSYLSNRKIDSKQIKNIGQMMFYPYARIVPMHIIIMIGGAFLGTISLLIFLIFKTLADVIMHAVEHSYDKHKTDGA